MSTLTHASATISSPLRLPPARSTPRWLRRLRHSLNIAVGGVILVMVILLALAAPLLTASDPIQVTPALRLRPPDALHIFGTDDFGRDIFTRVLYGARLSLQVGIISMLIAAAVGVTLGLLAGYYGGAVDAVIMRGVDVLLAFPGILLALAIIAVLGRSLTNVMIAVGISSIPLYARMARGSTLVVKSLDYVTAGRAIGASDLHLILRHVLPNILAPLIVISTNGVAGAIIAGAALSFLGLGAQSPTPEWGLMLSEGRVYLRNAWWVTTFPGIAIVITVMAINLLGDGLRDILDPRLKL